MHVDRSFAAVWAVALGVVTGFVASSVVRFSSASAELQYTAVAAVVSVAVCYRVLRTTGDNWRARTLVYRFGLYFLSLLVVSVVLTRLVWLAVGPGLLSLAGETVSVALAVGVAAWLSFYGGVEHVLAEYVPLDV